MFYLKVYFTDTEACQGVHLFPLCDVCDVGYKRRTITLSTEYNVTFD